MRTLWLIAGVFVALGIGNACRTPDTAPSAGCIQLASGLQHCPVDEHTP